MTATSEQPSWVRCGLPVLGPPCSRPACFEQFIDHLLETGYLRPLEPDILHWYSAWIPAVGQDGNVEDIAGWVGTLVHDDDPILVLTPGRIASIVDADETAQILDQANVADCFEMEVTDQIAEWLCQVADRSDGELPPFEQVEALNAVGWDISLRKYPQFPSPVILQDDALGEAYNLAIEWLD